MTSTKTQLPYDYYNIAVHCKPSNGTKYKSENLGKIQNFVFFEEKNKHNFFRGSSSWWSDCQYKISSNQQKKGNLEE
jgi:hypothetical protein